MKKVPFSYKIAKIYCSAILGDISTNIILRGINGSTEPINYFETFLNSLQTGTTFIAYPIMAKILNKKIPNFKNDFKNEKFKSIFYVGLSSAALITLINYPIQTIKEKKNEKFILYRKSVV